MSAMVIVGLVLCLLGILIQAGDWWRKEEARKELATVSAVIETLDLSLGRSAQNPPHPPINANDAELAAMLKMLDEAAQAAQLNNKAKLLELKAAADQVADGSAKLLFASWALIIVGTLLQVYAVTGA